MANPEGWKTIELIRGLGQSVAEVGAIKRDEARKNRAMQLEEDQFKVKQAEKRAEVQGNMELGQQMTQQAQGMPQAVKDLAAQTEAMLNSPSPEVRNEGRRMFFSYYKQQYIDPLQQKQDSLDKQLQGLFLESEEAKASGSPEKIKEVGSKLDNAMKAYQQYALLRNKYTADALKEKKPEQFDPDVLELKMINGYVPTQAEEEAFVRERYVGKVPGILPGEMLEKFYKSSTEKVRREYGYGNPAQNRTRPNAQAPTIPAPTSPIPDADALINQANTLISIKPKFE